MANELADFKRSSCTFRMYLQYCPEAVTYLLDRCLVIECAEQVAFWISKLHLNWLKILQGTQFQIYYSYNLIFQIQGNIFLDFFLFNPNSPSRCASELAMVKILLQSGKEKFIIHPVVETFMKMKWRKTWFLFWIYLFLFSSFFFALTAFSLAHYGALTAYAVPSLNDSLQKGYQFDYGSQRTCWWYADTLKSNLMILNHWYFTI